MTAERTYAMIKPDAMAADHKQGILDQIKENSFKVVAEQELQLTKDRAKEFYKEHDGKPFYDGLTDFMSSYVVCPSIAADVSSIRMRVFSLHHCGWYL